MKVTIQVGKVKIEYDQATEPTEFAALISRDKGNDGATRSEITVNAIRSLADKAAEINAALLD